MPSAESSDACELNELLERARGGDSVAIGLLLESQRARLRQMVALRLDNRLVGRIDPSDVVQDTLVIACQRMAEYLRDSTMPFYPWLRNLAWQRLVDLHRQHVLARKRSVSREEPLQIPDDSALRLGSELTVGGTGVLRNLVDAELVHRVRAALGELPTADREIVLLRHVEQLKFVECAAVLGVSESAVKHRYLRALERLQRQLTAFVREDRS